MDYNIYTELLDCMKVLDMYKKSIISLIKSIIIGILLYCYNEDIGSIFLITIPPYFLYEIYLVNRLYKSYLSDTVSSAGVRKAMLFIKK